MILTQDSFGFFKSLRFIIFLALPVLSHAQTFVPTTDNFVSVYSGPIDWADLDNDADLDIIYSGFDASSSNDFFLKVYENLNGTFVARSTALPDIRNGSFSLGDFDSDGDLDVLLSGLGANGNISELYKNNGGFSFSLVQSFPGLINTGVSWFDFDNDEDLDFLVSGVDDNSGGPDPFVNKMLVYENINGNFSLLNGTNLPGCTQCAMDWADSNGDGRIDVLITGFGPEDRGFTALYINNGDKTFARDQLSLFKNVSNGDVHWGDYDNDGDNDALLSGVLDDGNIVSVVYRNIDGVLREEQDIQIQSVGENWMGGTKWVDYNNDGHLDIVVSGRGMSVLVVDYQFKLFMNNGDNTFSEVQELNFGGSSSSAVDFGDYDNDGDVDLCYSGITPNGPQTGIYKNQLKSNPFAANTKPTPPLVTGFSERFFRKQVSLSWSSGTDAQTPAAGLSYNVYLHHENSRVVLPAANTASGDLLTVNQYNGEGMRHVLRDIPEGHYTWAVQSVDGGKLGSPFSNEKSFYQINGPEAVGTLIVDPQNVKITWIDNSVVENTYTIDRSVNATNGFSQLVILASNTASYNDNFNFLTDTYYYYRIQAANATKVSPYDSVRVLIPTAPTDLLALSVNASKIDLTWDDRSQYETGYELQRKVSGDIEFQTVTILPANTESYQDSGLNEGTVYVYRIRAVVSNGGSAFSGLSSARTNFRPLGDGIEVAGIEDQIIYLNADLFTAAFSDPDENDELTEIMITSLPLNGTLSLNGNPIVGNQEIALADLNSLQFVPLPNANGVTSFSFYNSDGKDFSAATYAVSLVVAAVNDPPAFTVPTTFIADEDFATTIIITPDVDATPSDELSQVVTYSIQTATDIVHVDLNSTTGEVQITSKQDQFGEVELTLTADDGQSEQNTFSRTIFLTVNAVNDAPVFSTISNLKVEYLAPISPVAFTVTDVDNDIASISVSAISDNQLLLKTENIIIEGVGHERGIVLNPEETIGNATITLSASDGETLAKTQFDLEIFSVTGLPETRDKNFKVYPNPFNSTLRIAYDGPIKNSLTALLFDQLGREVSRYEIRNHDSIVNTDGIRSGLYLLNIVEGNGNILLRERVLKAR